MVSMYICSSVKCGYEMIRTVILTTTKVIKYVHVHIVPFPNKKNKDSMLCVWLG